MNKKLQTEIREFIGNDPAQAVERVRANRIMSWNFFDTLFGVGLGLQNVETCFNERYGLTVYGSALVFDRFPAVELLLHDGRLPRHDAARSWRRAPRAFC